MPAAKKGLGKGLDSLIPAAKGTTTSTAAPVDKDALKGAVYLDINKVEPNKDQPRKKFDEDELQELCNSIKTFGVLDPLLVQKRKDFYEIIAGERRWRASKMAGLEKVPVIVMELSEQEFAEISLIENLQRKDLNPIEEALAYKRLLTEFNLKQDQVADRVSKSRSAVSNAMRILDLDERVQQMIIDEMISTGHARALLGIKNLESQYDAAQKVFDERLSVRETEKLVKDIQNNKKASESVNKNKLDPQIEAVYHDLEEQLKELLGTKVAINSKNEQSGRLEIDYYSSDELDRIIDLIRTIRK